MSDPLAPLVIDIGLFDAADTEYYIATGHRVIAVEANLRLTHRANKKFALQISEGRLRVIHSAIAATRDPVTLTISGNDLGSSSVVKDWIDTSDRAESYEVNGITMQDVLALAGERPRLIKIDIEGADYLCIYALTRDNRPEFVSVEAHSRAEEYLAYLVSIGFYRFKLIDQTSFRAVENMNSLGDRIARKIVRMAGFAEPYYTRRQGRLFSRHSSGPAPWDSDGLWHTAQETLALWETAQNCMKTRNVWFDIHAC